jgi:hypothetical protein
MKSIHISWLVKVVNTVEVATSIFGYDLNVYYIVQYDFMKATTIFFKIFRVLFENCRSICTNCYNCIFQ